KLLPTFAMRWLVPRLARFHHQHPGITVRINTAHHGANFEHEDVEASVQYGTGTWPGLMADRLFGELLVPVCSPRPANGLPPPRHPHELRSHVLLHTLQRPDFWRQCLAQAQVSGVAIEGGLSFENSGLAYQAALDGLGIAIAHLAFVQEDLARGR